MSLTAEQILNADDRQLKKVHVADWGGDVYLRTISGAERDAFEAETFRQGNPNYKNLRARYLALTLTDENGKQIFSKDQVSKLGEKSAPVLDRLFTISAKMNAMSEEDVSELLGNSEAVQAEDSTSD
jgi:hypothetical protein